MSNVSELNKLLNNYKTFSSELLAQFKNKPLVEAIFYS